MTALVVFILIVAFIAQLFTVTYLRDLLKEKISNNKKMTKIREMQAQDNFKIYKESHEKLMQIVEQDEKIQKMISSYESNTRILLTAYMAGWNDFGMKVVVRFADEFWKYEEYFDILNHADFSNKKGLMKQGLLTCLKGDDKKGLTIRRKLINPHDFVGDYISVLFYDKGGWNSKRDFHIDSCKENEIDFFKTKIEARKSKINRSSDKGYDCCASIIFNKHTCEVVK